LKEKLLGEQIDYKRRAPSSPSTQIYNQLELMLYNYPTLELLVLFSLSNPNPTNTKYN
jgi:hypothetical protein